MRTAFVGMVDDTAAFGVLTDNPHAEGGEDGKECEDEDGGHRVILNEFSVPAYSISIFTKLTSITNQDLN